MSKEKSPNAKFPLKMLLHKVNLELDGNGEKYIDPKTKELYVVFNLSHEGKRIYIQDKKPDMDKDGNLMISGKL